MTEETARKGRKPMPPYVPIDISATTLAVIYQTPQGAVVRLAETEAEANQIALDIAATGRIAAIFKGPIAFAKPVTLKSELVSV